MKKYKRNRKQAPEPKPTIPIQFSSGNPANLTWEEIINRYHNGNPHTIFGTICY